MKKVLFVCSRNKLRSPTAEQIFSKCSDLEVMSAGLNRDSVYQISSEDIKWADYIFLMESMHKRKMLTKYRKYIKDQRIIVLNIPDDYEFMDPQLIELLLQKVSKHIESN